MDGRGSVEHCGREPDSDEEGYAHGTRVRHFPEDGEPLHMSDPRWR